MANPRNKRTQVPAARRPFPKEVVIRVGVTGHRELDEKHVGAIKRHVRDIFERITKGARLAAATWPAALQPARARLRIISALAEGSDQLVAEVGLEPAFAADLHCPLPAGAEEYLTTFSSDESRRKFQDLIGKASAIIELDGTLLKVQDREPDNSNRVDRRWRSYRNLGKVLAQNSDVLIAILDPAHANQPGGTAEVIKYALELNHKVVWIDPTDQEKCYLLKALTARKFQDLLEVPDKLKTALKGEYGGPLDALSESVKSLLTLVASPMPSGPPQDEEAARSYDLEQTELLVHFLKEVEHRPGPLARLCGKFWSLVIWDSLPDSEAATKHASDHAPATAAPLFWAFVRHNGRRPWRAARRAWKNIQVRFGRDPGEETAWRGRTHRHVLNVHDVYEHFRKSASELTHHYAGLHRSSFFTIAIFGFLAVAFPAQAWVQLKESQGRLPHIGLTEVRDELLSEKWIILELIVLVLMFLLYRRHKARKWAERLLDYRHLTERLRHMIALALIGRSAPLFPYADAHFGKFDPRDTWMERLFRSIVREVSLELGPVLEEREGRRVARMDLNQEYLESARSYMKTIWIDKQIAYHQKNQARAKIFHEAAEWLLVGLVVIAILVCSIHLVKEVIELPWHGSTTRLPTSWLFFLAVVLPALGAAVHSISNQAEVASLDHRSAAMILELRGISEQLEQLTSPITSDRLAEIADEAVDLMLREVIEWRVLFHTDPLRPPG